MAESQFEATLHRFTEVALSFIGEAITLKHWAHDGQNRQTDK